MRLAKLTSVVCDNVEDETRYWKILCLQESAASCIVLKLSLCRIVLEESFVHEIRDFVYTVYQLSKGTT